jgi:xyloglucan:xyloglucosyl transferase
VYKNNADLGVPYPNSKPMALYSSLWDGSQWATQGGLIKLDWAGAPFVASYRNFDGLDACTVYNNDISSCVATTSHWWEASAFQTLDNTQLDELNWVRQNYQLYDYCTDPKRYPTPPPECSTNSV